MCEDWITEKYIDDVRNAAKNNYTVIQRVKELHYAVNDGGCGDPDCCSPLDSEDFCIICGGYEYPCETIKILDGKQ
jgi:hypothetical protein